MARDPLYGVTMNGWERLVTSMETNAQDIPHLEAQRQELADTLVQVREVSTRQAALTAAKQEATKELQTLLAEGRKLATFLRAGIRQRYGNRSEKLVEFNLQPFRSRPRPAAEPTTQPEPPASPTGNVP
ncbi:MAG TPA: hypothetical protein VE685_09065 [Thermoanaerobaculia bacterium]|nr:hypothetical protein [Thermoanaerobaculia bacterium]